MIPKAFRYVRVVPFSKMESRLDAGDYLPVDILNHLLKLLEVEWVVHIQLEIAWYSFCASVGFLKRIFNRFLSHRSYGLHTV